MGAISTGGVRVINTSVVQWLNISEADISEVAQEEQLELERRDKMYRGEQPLPEVSDRIIILVDDGIATGSTLRAAITTLKQQQPQKIIVAVPVAPPETCQELSLEVDEVIALKKPNPLHSISMWYEDFSQTTDEEVRELLLKANRSLVSSMDS